MLLNGLALEQCYPSNRILEQWRIVAVQGLRLCEQGLRGREVSANTNISNDGHRREASFCSSHLSYTYRLVYRSLPASALYRYFYPYTPHIRRRILPPIHVPHGSCAFSPRPTTSTASTGAIGATTPPASAVEWSPASASRDAGTLKSKA